MLPIHQKINTVSRKFSRTSLLAACSYHIYRALTGIDSLICLECFLQRLIFPPARKRKLNNISTNFFCFLYLWPIYLILNRTRKHSPSSNSSDFRCWNVYLLARKIILFFGSSLCCERIALYSALLKWPVAPPTNWYIWILFVYFRNLRSRNFKVKEFLREGIFRTRLVLPTLTLLNFSVTRANHSLIRKVNIEREHSWCCGYSKVDDSYCGACVIL